VLFYSFVTRNTIFGRHVYAVGGNRLAAELSGVKSKRVNFLVMMNMAILSALAGMIFVARSVASGPQDGMGWELDAIAAVFIGGAAVSGGIGTVTGSIVGGLVMAVLNNGLQLMGVGSDRVQIIKGMVLLLAVAVDVWNKSQGRPSITGFLMRGRNEAVRASWEGTESYPAGSGAIKEKVT
jgi:putative multiple sugar transport system permease protein